MADAVLVRTIQTRLQKIVFRPSVCWVLACLPCLALTGCSQAMNPMGIRPVITVYVGIPGFEFPNDDAQSEQFDVSKEIILQKVPFRLENANIHYRAFPESKLAALVEERNQYGLGPDLIVSTELTARKMRARNMLKPFEVKKPSAWSERYKIVADILSVEKDTYYSLPVFIESQFACGNKQLIESMPVKIQELPLIELKANVPFSVNMFQLSEEFYFFNIFGVGQELLKMFYVDSYDLDGDIIPDYIRFLKPSLGKRDDILKEEVSFEWSSIPPKYYFDSGMGDRRLKDFEKGDIAWMPCRNSSIERLDRTMEGNLLVSLLPGLKENVPAIGNPNVMVVSMGKQSSRNQQGYASEWINNLIRRPSFRDSRFTSLSKFLSLEEFELHKNSELSYFRDIKDIVNRSSLGHAPLPSSVLKSELLNMVWNKLMREFFELNLDVDEKVARKFVSELRERIYSLRQKIIDSGDK